MINIIKLNRNYTRLILLMKMMLKNRVQLIKNRTLRFVVDVRFRTHNKEVFAIDNKGFRLIIIIKTARKYNQIHSQFSISIIHYGKKLCLLPKEINLRNEVSKTRNMKMKSFIWKYEN